MLSLKNLTVSRDGKQILKNINLELLPNQITILYSSNGSGKTTLCQTICGNPAMEIVSGEITLEKLKINDLNSTQRSQLGIFTTFQNPPEIKGVSTLNLIKQSYISIKKTKPQAKEFLANIKKYNQELGLKDGFYKQDFNFGASGGEKKKNELLQMLMLQPKVVILDEVDSGLDTTSKQSLIELLKKFKTAERTILVITHDQHFYKQLFPEQVFSITDGVLTEI